MILSLATRETILDSFQILLPFQLLSPASIKMGSSELDFWGMCHPFSQGPSHSITSAEGDSFPLAAH